MRPDIQPTCCFKFTTRRPLTFRTSAVVLLIVTTNPPIAALANIRPSPFPNVASTVVNSWRLHRGAAAISSADGWSSP